MAKKPKTKQELRKTAITRLNTCYTKAVKIGEFNFAITAQKELNKLNKLHDMEEGDPGVALNDDAAVELAEIAAHMEPLEYKADTVAESVRLLIADYMKAQSANG